MERPGRFSLSYLHSMYNEPVLEEFRVAGDTILLEGVRTKSPAVMEYYGFDAVWELHPVERRMSEILLRVRMGTPQSLLHGDRSLSLDRVGDAGERIRLRARTLPLPFYLLGIFPGSPGESRPCPTPVSRAYPGGTIGPG